MGAVLQEVRLAQAGWVEDLPIVGRRPGADAKGGTQVQREFMAHSGIVKAIHCAAAMAIVVALCPSPSRAHTDEEQRGAGNAPAPAQPASSLEIARSDNALQYHATWGCYSAQNWATSGWGVTVRVANAADKAVSEPIGPFKLLDVNGKEYDEATGNVSACMNVGVDENSGSLTLMRFGFALDYVDGTTKVGRLSSTIANGRDPNLTLSLLPHKSVTLLLIFSAPEDSKPTSLLWPPDRSIGLQ